MTDPLEHIKVLAQKIGPRPSTGRGERDAADYIAERLQSFGFVVRKEPFRSVRSFSHVYAPIYLLSLLGFLFSATGAPALGLLLEGVAFVAFMGENTTSLRLISTLIPKGRSQNVVGRLVPRELPRRRLVIVAHYDTTKAGMMFHPRLVRNYRLTFVLILFCMLLLSGVSLLEVGSGQPVLAYLGVPFAVVVAYALVVQIQREIFFKHVAGANNNASGVAVALSLAEGLSTDAPIDTEVLVVATGCQEVGSVGMESFLKRHADELERAWIVNLESVGVGSVHWVERQGMILSHKAGKELREMADRVSRMPGISVGPTTYRIAGTDAEPALLRGLEAMTVIALKNGLPVNFHWETDTVETIDPDTVDTTYRFVEAMVRRLIA
jgi:acetylornithine deacetylase/succinyl-diaminopimelate desuccinylase-like protein